jgi:tetratricopeptide (TPR) repeat protein
VKGNSAANHGECLRDECLTDYLEGGLDPLIRSAFESHLVACDKCRQNLALFMRLLREDVKPDEEAVLQQLEAAWAARELQPVPLKKRWVLQKRYIPYAAAGIAAMLVIAFLVGGPPFAPRQSIAGQITQAMLVKSRPFEPRVVGQAYMGVDEVTRSAGDPVPDVLAPEMTENSADAYEMGRYFLLRKEYSKAIKYLRMAVQDPKGVPADVHNDLGVAYMQNDRASGPAAEAEFKSALERSPTHAPALFNLSILYSRLDRVEEGKQRRQQYLALDPDSGWAKEIQKLADEDSDQR